MKKIPMVKTICLAITGVLWLSNAYSQVQSKGLIWEDDQYSEVERVGTGMNFAANEPVVSLKAYCPQPGSQGNMGSCVGWASSYGALSIALAQKNNLTDPVQITSIANSALYVYNQIKLSDCQHGSRITDALKLLKTNGACLKTDFDPGNCNTLPGMSEHSKAQPYRIKDYATLFGISDPKETKIGATINSLASGKPVVIGMNVLKSFDLLRSEKWDSNMGSKEFAGGHAMVVIGYDDNNRVFEILNSWGTSWGNGGFCKIGYDDFATYVKYGFQFTLDERKDPEIDPVLLSGEFVFERFLRWDEQHNTPIFAEVRPMLNNNLYTLSGTVVKVGDNFRVTAKNVRKDKYIYVFSIDPSNKVEILYPKDKAFEQSDNASLKELPRVPSEKAVIQIPGGNQAIQTDKAGTDYLCILYSDKVIDDIRELVLKVHQSSGIDFWTKLKSGFGDRLMPVDSIEYSNGMMSVNANSAEGYIAPIVLKVEVTQ
ncbi:MAG: C39 family peptidase [Sphingobacteriales bacterium]|nr:MAG: C39 family peptidase [Sphingobacteriales bacterium]